MRNMDRNYFSEAKLKPAQSLLHSLLSVETSQFPVIWRAWSNKLIHFMQKIYWSRNSIKKTIPLSTSRTSIIAITLSLFVRRTCITFSQVERKFPSIPLTSIAFTSILVKRKGTYIRDISRNINYLYTTKQLIKSDNANCRFPSRTYFFRKLLPVHWSLKTVSKIYVQYLSAVKEQSDILNTWTLTSNSFAFSKLMYL